MSIVWMIYFAGICNNVGALLATISTFGGLIYAAAASYAIMVEEKEFKDLHPKKTIAALFICAFTAAIIPSEKTIYMMTGASIAQDIASNPKTIATMDKVYKLIDGKLDEQLKHISKDNKEN